VCRKLFAVGKSLTRNISVTTWI